MRAYMGIQEGQTVELPEPREDGRISVETALRMRRSHRTYASTPAGLAHIGQLLWAAYGKTPDEDIAPAGDTVPSAGGIYPLNVYLIAGNVTGLEHGVYRYERDRHSLTVMAFDDTRVRLSQACLGQSYIADAPASLVITCTCSRIRSRYGSRGMQYAWMEAGHAVQNVFLQAVDLNMGTVAVGAFDTAAVKEIIGIPADELPLVVMPVGNV